MQTLIIEHTDRQTGQVFKQMAKALGLTVKVKPETPPATITNPELIRRIEAHEARKKSGDFDGYRSFTIDELKQEMQNLVNNAQHQL
jgi:hypothetical protein